MNAICFLVVQSGGGGLGTCLVVVEQQAVGAVVWTACTPGLEDLGQARDVPLGVDCLLVWGGTEATSLDLAKTQKCFLIS